MFALLIAVPLVFGALLSQAKTQKSIAFLARIGSGAVIVLSIAFCGQNFNQIIEMDLSAVTWLKPTVMLLEALMAAYLLLVAVRNKSVLLGVMAGAQFLLMAGFELNHKGGLAPETVYVDKLSLLMILIVGIIGGLICIYAIEYMKDYHRHHPEVKDRRGFFFAVLFGFLSAMFGLVIANDMTLMLFCWELTSLASFLLIGYTRTKEATRNSLLAINTNVFGGLLFTVAIVILGVTKHVTDFNSMLELEDTALADLVVFLLAGAALTKSAQMPFSKWLLGAMVAPTPTSAMLHSSTMVKAGVYLLLRLSPMLGHNPAGITVTLLGGITFFVTALIAVSQTDAKRVLAYSTISNLGLIVACAGIDTGESLWAAIMLIVFHAIAKSLLFLSVGSTEHQLGSRDLEDMDGLFRISFQLTLFLIIGIAGMFLAPFGMLISKWAAMKAFLDSNNIFTVLLVAFGSTVTLFFWTKWMGKLIANAHRKPPNSYVMRIDEKISLNALAGLVIAACLFHPLISQYIIIPYIHSNRFIDFVSPIDPAATSIIILMLCMVVIVPLVLARVYRKDNIKRSLVYMSGENVGDNEYFYAGMGQVRRLDLRNWYLNSLFGEHVLLQKCIVVGAGVLLVGFFAVLEGFVV